jgi:hypothetical protein
MVGIEKERVTPAIPREHKALVKELVRLGRGAAWGAKHNPFGQDYFSRTSD